MTRDELVADRLYWVEDVDLFFVSPDGWGGYWYDDEDEVMEAYGEVATVYPISHLTDF